MDSSVFSGLGRLNQVLQALNVSNVEPVWSVKQTKNKIFLDIVWKTPVKPDLNIRATTVTCEDPRQKPAVQLSTTDTKAAVSKAVSSLQAGNVIAVPTDTVYGVAALAQDINAVKKLYAVKGRNGHNPIAICVSNVQDLFRWSHVTVTQDLLNDLLPGAVTLVFRRKPELNPEFNPFTDLIGIRIPNYPFVQQIAAAAGSPVALTSANISAAKSTLCVEEFENLWPHLDLVFDGGIIGDSEEARLGSTVINLSVPGQFTIIRPGSVYQKTVDILKNKYGLKEFR